MNVFVKTNLSWLWYEHPSLHVVEELINDIRWAVQFKSVAPEYYIHNGTEPSFPLIPVKSNLSKFLYNCGFRNLAFHFEYKYPNENLGIKK